MQNRALCMILHVKVIIFGYWIEIGFRSGPSRQSRCGPSIQFTFGESLGDLMGLAMGKRKRKSKLRSNFDFLFLKMPPPVAHPKVTGH
jgi:hypothetical protein